MMRLRNLLAAAAVLSTLFFGSNAKATSETKLQGLTALGARVTTLGSAAECGISREELLRIFLIAMLDIPGLAVTEDRYGIATRVNLNTFSAKVRGECVTSFELDVHEFEMVKLSFQIKKHNLPVQLFSVSSILVGTDFAGEVKSIANILAKAWHEANPLIARMK